VLVVASALAAACGNKDKAPAATTDAGALPEASAPTPTVTPTITATTTPPPPDGADASDGGDAADASDASDSGEREPDATGYAAAVLGDAPLVYYRLGEDAGPTARNRAASGSAFNAHYNNFDAGSFGRPGLLASDPNTAVLCSGATDPTAITLPLVGPTEALKIAGAFTIEAWVTRTDASGGTFAIVSTKGSGKDGYSFGITKDHLFLACHGQANVPSTLVVPPDGKPHYVATVFDGTSSVRFYLDAASETVPIGAVIATKYATTDLFSICAFATPNGLDSFRWTGVVDEVAVYAAALTPARIAAHRSAGAPDGG
jgi:hypothetical protein